MSPRHAAFPPLGEGGTAKEGGSLGFETSLGLLFSLGEGGTVKEGGSVPRVCDLSP